MQPIKQLAAFVLLLAFSATVPAQELIQVHQDFSKDPGWEWKDNRVVAQDPPIVKQDFGWAATNITGAGPGEIGGTMWRSRTPAWYALPLNRPLSFKDKFSFSARVAFLPKGGRGTAYLGFFNHELQGWRVWNSMAVRLNAGKKADQVAIGADSMDALWHAQGGSEGYVNIPADGSPHTLHFTYDPDLVPRDWQEFPLAKYVTHERRTPDQILELAQKDQPDLTKQKVSDMLVEAFCEGLVTYLDRTNGTSSGKSGEFWFRNEGAERQGAMILQVDDTRPFKVFLFKAAKDEPVYMDRFGLFNFQLYHEYIDPYVSDLTVNGHKVDLSKDPGWQGEGNRVQFAEQDFQREDFGYCETNWAGDGIGEIGGQFTSTEPQDPVYGYYADDIGKLTLDDPISFSGNVCFVNDSTDAGMQFGYFNSKSITAELNPHRNLKTNTNSLGILIEGSAHAGKQFHPQVTSSKDAGASKGGIAFNPTRDRHAFKFEYDPKANNNLGQIKVTLDDKVAELNLTEQQRADGASFDRFGVANLRVGGKFVEVYFDDLTYTARRPKDYKPVFHKQEVTKVPYPERGRAF